MSTNISGAITTGGTAQQLCAGKLERNGFFIQNTSVGDLWINEQGVAAAASPSIKIPAGALYESPEGCQFDETISIYGATTGQTFTGREY